MEMGRSALGPSDRTTWRFVQRTRKQLGADGDLSRLAALVHSPEGELLSPRATIPIVRQAYVAKRIVPILEGVDQIS